MKTIGEISKKTKLPQVTYRRSGRTYVGCITEARGRYLVVSLLPGDTIAIRPLGRKRAEYITVADAYQRAYFARVRSEQAQKLNAKKRRGRA